MDDLQTRAYRTDDAAAVADLINACLTAGGGEGLHVASEIEDVMNTEIKDVATDTRLITAADGRLAGVAFVPMPPEGGHRVDLYGGVHPDRRGAGIGRQLLSWQLERAAARHNEVAPDTPWVAQVVCGVADAATIALCERFGFAATRYFVAMTAPTTPPPVATLADGIRIATYSQDQEYEVYAVHAAAFGDLDTYQDRGFDAWAATSVRSENFLPELARVALAGDQIVSYVLPYDTGTPGKLYMGQVGTARTWRGRGIAKALLADSLGAAGQAGYTHAALDTEADNPHGTAGIYAKVGFIIDQHIVAYHKPL